MKIEIQGRDAIEATKELLAIEGLGDFQLKKYPKFFCGYPMAKTS